MSGAPDWVATARSIPVAFAQVREDPELDFWALDQVGRRARIVMVASGGCTAAALATRDDVETLHCVDPNPAQIALTRLKLELLKTAEPAEKLRLLGHAGLHKKTRANRLAELLGHLGLQSDVLGPLEVVAACGPDHAGRYECLFAALRAELTEFAQPLQAILDLSAPDEQARRVRPETSLGRALDAAFEKIMALPNLVALFGEAATRNPREPFAAHFAWRLRHVLGTQPAAGNPFLSQMLLGRFAPQAEHFWLRSPRVKPRAAISCEESPMLPALEKRKGEFDLVHLSNILDWRFSTFRPCVPALHGTTVRERRCSPATAASSTVPFVSVGADEDICARYPA